MVYYGPVSTGCERCRRRKIKCEQGLPGCAQCKKAGAECSGYRNPADLMFRDENARTINRTQACTSTTAKSKSVLSCVETKGSSTRDLVSSNRRNPKTVNEARRSPSELSTPNVALTPSYTDRAVNFFWVNFVDSNIPFIEQFGDFLKREYVSGALKNALSGVVEALGMASIGNISGAPQLMGEAKRSYGHALAMTNRALRDPSLATSDAVLATIWFLLLFESVTSQTFKQYQSWHTHIEGASALIHLRGKQQFETELGHILFFKFRAQLISSYTQRNIPVPDSVASLFFASTQQGHSVCPQALGLGAELLICDSAILPPRCSVEFCNLRAAIERRTITDPQEIIQAAQSIEKSLSTILHETSLDWTYETCVVEDRSEHLFQGRCEIHLNVARAQALNHIRRMSMMINDIIADQCNILLSQEDVVLTPEEEALAQDAQANILAQAQAQAQDMLVESTSRIKQLSLAICGSVPYILGTLPKPLQPVQDRGIQTVEAFALLWPLFVCADSLNVSKEMQVWSRNRLLYINRMAGIKQAGLMARVLELHYSQEYNMRLTQCPSLNTYSQLGQFEQLDIHE